MCAACGNSVSLVVALLISITNSLRFTGTPPGRREMQE